MGQGVSRAVSAISSREERQAARIMSSLNIENMALQNDRIRSEIALMNAPGTPPALSSYGSDADARYPTQHQMPLGYGDTAPFLRKGLDSEGNTMRFWNDDLGDNEVMQALTSLGISVPEWLANNILMRAQSGRVSAFGKAKSDRQIAKHKYDKRWSDYHKRYGYSSRYNQ
jgi:hypothetical protein